MKLRSVTSTIVLFIAVAGVSIGFGLLATAAVPLDDRRRAAWATGSPSPSPG